MNKWVFALLLICSSFFGSVNFYFEGGNLVIKGLENYDSVKIVIDQVSFIVDAKEVSIPWQKGADAILTLIPIANDQEKEPIKLKIDATKDLAPKITLSVPTYLPAQKIQLPISIVDDWDELIN